MTDNCRPLRSSKLIKAGAPMIASIWAACAPLPPSPQRENPGGSFPPSSRPPANPCKIPRQYRYLLSERVLVTAPLPEFLPLHLTKAQPHAGEHNRLKNVDNPQIVSRASRTYAGNLCRRSRRHLAPVISLHSFTAPPVKPLIMCCWKMRTMITSGSVTTTEAAAMSPHGT